jgi:hypothetical protein
VIDADRGLLGLDIWLFLSLTYAQLGNAKELRQSRLQLRKMSTAVLTNGHSNGPVPVRVILETADKNSPWVVQKFGGTSVGKFPVNIVEDIVRYGLDVSFLIRLLISLQRDPQEQQSCSCVFCTKHWQKSRGNHKPVSQELQKRMAFTN